MRLHFIEICQGVPISIFFAGICTRLEFLQVAKAVTVLIKSSVRRIVRIQEGKLIFKRIGHPIPVNV